MTLNPLIRARKVVTSLSDEMPTTYRNIYISFLLMVLGILLVALYLTFQFQYSATKTFPQIVALITMSAIIIDIGDILFAERLFSFFDFDLRRAKFERDSDEDLSLNLLPTLYKILWVIVYIFSLNYIGFFTGTFLFSISYMISNSDENLKNKISKSLIWTTSLIVFLWVLFIYVLRATAIFRLGPLI